MEKKYLNEEKYQNARKGLIILGVCIILIGALIGGILITKGISNKNTVENEYTEEKKQEKISELNQEYASLEKEIQPKLDEIKVLEREKSDAFFDNKDRYYAIEDEIDIIEKEIKPIEEKLSNLKVDIFRAENEDVSFQKKFNVSKYIPYFIFGGFIILFGIIIGGSIIAKAFKRNILAYGLQTGIPLVEEGAEVMTPMLGKMAKAIKRNLDENEETYKDLANKSADINKEAIKKTAGAIKEGFSESKEICPNCNEKIDKDSAYCKSCGKKI